MINLTAARAWLATTLEVVPGVRVCPRGVDGPFDPPAIILGQPEVEFDQVGGVCGTDRVEFPLAVVVRHAPAGPTSSQAELEELWPQVVDVLRGALAADPSMGGLCSAAWLASSSFGGFDVQGRSFPAQQITVLMH